MREGGFKRERMSVGWGVLAALGSGAVNAIGYTVQRSVLVREPRRYACVPRWWVGLALLLLAAALGGVALTYVPAAVAVALGSGVVVFNAALATCGPGVDATARVGTAEITLGSAALAPATPTSRRARPAPGSRRCARRGPSRSAVAIAASAALSACRCPS